jgi:hypothetical protein
MRCPQQQRTHRNRGCTQVVANIGKGLMKMLLGGGSSSSKQQQQQQQAPQADSRSSGRQADYGREEARQQAMRGSPEAERREYLASLEHRGAPREAGEVVPTAPVLVSFGGQRLGVGEGVHHNMAEWPLSTLEQADS